ncbi:BON domain-containing protein [Nitrosomonas supralitoralis]|uniref:Transporter n=1 Tax=Nitrosomonas supralitoralis TaxID=2116706 RepID=A0A2P7NY90_9PROT|nr:BON domain-containing protein [Nitrosomonas supralitoralis]PSJ18433.1 transporter [Nitrosomonas supralitoralis]
MKITNKDKQNISIKSVLMVTVVFVVLGLTGCQQEGPAEKMGQKLDRSIENAEQKIGKEINEVRKSLTDKSEESIQYLDDSVITLDVQAAILNDPLLEVSDIKVTTVNGIVQLSGMVDSQELVDRAAEVASAQKDVRSVENNLIVKVVLAE